jgi:beta-lactam-binding protein with PASTA domain
VPVPAPVARKCVVPKIAKGTKLGVAENAIKAAGCVVGHVTKVHSKVKKGRVVSQSIVGGKAVPLGTLVGLKVAVTPAHAKHLKHGKK